LLTYHRDYQHHSCFLSICVPFLGTDPFSSIPLDHIPCHPVSIHTNLPRSVRDYSGTVCALCPHKLFLAKTEGTKSVATPTLPFATESQTPWVLRIPPLRALCLCALFSSPAGVMRNSESRPCLLSCSKLRL